jgi:hypothetical protein
VTDARETLNVVFKISPVTVFLMPDFDNGCRAYVLDGSGDDPYRANISLRYWSALLRGGRIQRDLQGQAFRLARSRAHAATHSTFSLPEESALRLFFGKALAQPCE